MQTISKHQFIYVVTALLTSSIWSCTPKTQGNKTKEPISEIVAGYDKATSPAYKAPLAKAVKAGWKPTTKAKIVAQTKAIADKINIYSSASTFYYSHYVTGTTNNTSTTFYRVFGGRAKLGGSFVTTEPIKNKVETRKTSALLTAWGNAISWEAKIDVPKGTTISIGVVAPQLSHQSPPQFLPGGAAQIILPYLWMKDTYKTYKVAVRKLDAKGKPVSNFKDIPFNERTALETAILNNDKSAIKRIMGLE